MKWFKHDSDASSDAKIKKLIIRHGAIGYAVYFHCLELITADLSESHLTFELEHDSEIIADNLKINGNGKESGMEIVEKIMFDIISLGLFVEDSNRLFCLKLAKRLDTSMTSNPNFRALIKKSHDSIMIPSSRSHDSVMQEENRIEENRTEQKRKENKKITKNKHGEYKHVLLTDEELSKLSKEFSSIDAMIKNLDEYIEMTGKKYKNHNLVLRKWQKGKAEAAPAEQAEEERHADIRRRMEEARRMMEA